ncbi:MAG: hypothetical protein ABSE73_26260 [Planctomycetota bacterium]
MVERGGTTSISRAEIKAGVFLTFCLALFIAMLFVLGKFGRSWRGHEAIHVLFTDVSALRREAPVRYNGMDLGRVQNLKIVRASPGLLARLPPLAKRDLPNLPLTEEEREQLKQLADDGPGGAFGERVGALVKDRTMVLLTLDVLRDNDTRRFHEDDEYHIVGSLMSDNAVEIRTGCGHPSLPARDRVFLGVGGDMYTDLGKSLAQVKDILGSMAELVNSGEERRAIRNQLQMFDDYTGRIESAAGSIHSKLEQAWDDADTRLGDGVKTLADVETKLKDLRPKLDAALESAGKSIVEARGNFAKAADSASQKVWNTHKEASATLEEWRTQAAEYRESLPSKIHNAREWSERFEPTVGKIDHFLTRADDQLDKGIASTRTALAGYVETGSGLEETTYRLKRWPASFANTPEEESAKLHDLVWRRDLARRQYLELRAELERLREGLAAGKAPEQTHLTRVADILRELDAELGSEPERPREAPEEPSGAPPKKKKGK